MNSSTILYTGLILMVAIALYLPSIVGSCKSSELVDVKILMVVPAKIDGWKSVFAHTTVECVDTKERVIIQGSSWGKTGEVFKIKQSNLKW